MGMSEFLPVLLYSNYVTNAVALKQLWLGLTISDFSLGFSITAALSEASRT